MFVYCIYPIDTWTGWFPASDLFRINDSPNLYPSDYLDPSDWGESWKLAQHGARKLGWEGDIRGHPWVTMLPINNGPFGVPPYDFIIAWKQDNNGTTFVASPVRLPHLEDGDNWTLVTDDKRAPLHSVAGS